MNKSLKHQEGIGALSIVILIIFGFLLFGTYIYYQNYKQISSASPTPVSRYLK